MRKRAIHRIVLSVSMLVTGFLFFQLSQLFATNPPVVDFGTALPLSQTDWSGTIGTNTSTEYSAASGISTSTAGQISVVPTASGTSWLDSDYTYRHQIVINSGQVSSTQTNFPMLLNENNFDSTFFSAIQNDGLDIVFTDSDGTSLLPREIVSVSTTAQTIEAYVRVPSISASTNTVIYVYYGNATTSQANSSSVWSNYAAVWHLNEDPSISSDGACGGSSYDICDSSGNGNHGTSTNLVSGSLVSGQIGNALQFVEGNNSWVSFGTGTSIGNMGDFSVSFWIQHDGTPQTDSSGRVFHKSFGTCGGGGWVLGFDDDGGIYNSGTFSDDVVSPSFLFDVNATTQGHYNYMNGGSLSANTWHHTSVIWDDSFTNTSTRYFVDGAEIGLGHVRAGSGSSIDDTNCALYLGNLPTNSRRLDAMLDEIRIMSTPATPSYAATEYNNQSSSTQFATVGSQETEPGNGTLTSAIFDAGSNNGWGTIRWNTTDESNTVVKVRTSNDSGMSGATAFSSCSAVSQDADMTSNGCVTDGHRYIQYQVTLSTTTVVFSDIAFVALGGNSVSAYEDAAGTITITASIDEASSSTVSVPFTVSGTAINPDDHNLSDGTITIPSGQLFGTTSVSVVADSTAESDETIILTMGTPTNGQAGNQNTYTITITDDDTPIYAYISSTANGISENSGATTLTATLSQTATQTVNVVVTSTGSAILNSDFTISSTTIVIPPGSTTGTVTVTGTVDSAIEGIETILFEISSVSGSGATEYQTQQAAISLFDHYGDLDVTAYHTSYGQSDPSTVGQYEVFELSLEHPVDYGGMNNVTDITVTTTFTSPLGATQTIQGFYFGTVTSTNTYASTSIWKVRIASSTTGTWTYNYQFGRDSTGEETIGSGSFTITTSTRDGFIRRHPVNGYMWVTENTNELFQVHGFGDCLYRGQDVFKMDGGDADGPFREEGTDYGYWADIYREIGYNTFRLQNYNCSQNFADENGDNFNFEVMQYFDHTIDRMHTDGFHILFGIWGFTHGSTEPIGAQPLYDSTPTIEPFYDYIVARYGAYVDWWELENELQHDTPAEQYFATTSIAYIRSIDPYGHPITTNYYSDDRIRNDISTEWMEAEFLTPHIFSNPADVTLFSTATSTAATLKAVDSVPKPIFYGELGFTTSNWVTSSVRIERLRSLSYLMSELGYLQWNHSNGTATMSGAAANYLGLGERMSMSFVHWFYDLVTQYDTTIATTSVSDETQIQALAVTSTESIGIYVNNYNRFLQPQTGETVTLVTPFSGTGYWILPESGEVVSTTSFTTGTTVFDVPGFDIDLAMFGTASSSLDTEPLAMVGIVNTQDDDDLDNDSDTDYGPDFQEYGPSSTPFGVAPLTLDFSAASSSDLDGGSLTYLWEFGDGNTSTNVTTTHTYTQKGKYIAKLTVTDDEGNSSFMTFVVRAEADVNPGINDAPYLNPPYSTTYTVREGDYVRITNYNRGDPEQASVGSSYSFSSLSDAPNVVRGLLNSVSGLPAGASFGTSTGAEDVVDFSWVPNFDQAGTYDITLTITDDGGLSDSQDYTIVVLDAGDIDVILTTTSLALTEDGQLTNIALQLDSRPTSTVTVALVNDDADLTLSTTSIAFTPANWKTPVAVTVEATDDSSFEQTHTATLSYSISQSGGAYDAYSLSDTTFTITDNDTTSSVGITLTTSSLSISEAGTVASYTVVLDSQPTSTVIVDISATSQANVSPSTLTFTTSTWDTAQTVTVTAASDSIVEGTHSATVSHTVTQASGGAFDGISLGSLTFTITDDDSTSTGNTTSEGSLSAFALINTIQNQNTTPATSNTTNNATNITCPLTPGQPYKGDQESAVYLVTNTCTLRPFQNPTTYFTYFDSWNEVTTLPQSEIDRIPSDTVTFVPAGPKYDPQYGALVKTVDDPKVYLLLGTERYWITDEIVFEALGYQWEWIEDVSPELLNQYSIGEEITYTDHHPNYTLIKYPDSPRVYRLEPDPTDPTKQVKRHIPDEQTFEALNFRWDRIVTVDVDEKYATGEDLQ